MNNLVISNAFRFLFLVLLQVAVFNNINLFGYLNPMVYIVFVALFPVRKNKLLLMLTSFLLGLSIDFFSDSGGIHAAATLCIGFLRLPILKAIMRKSDFDYILFHIKQLTPLKAISFIASLTLIHHFIVFSLSYFRFEDFLKILSNTILTSLFSIIVISIGIVLFTKKK